MMNVDVIKQILDLMREHELAEFELEQEGLKIRVRKQGNTPVFTLPAPTLPAVSVTPAQMPALAAAAGAAAAGNAGAGAKAAGEPASGELVDDLESMELAVVTSPIVGTFYRAPDPSSPSFVEVGQTISKGQTLCIIEAMKLMNEIESEYEGQVVKAYVENGQPVQYGERLFAIKRG
jgi:acetyl-CoA carboxylase biotin carboxyl carrier protein